MGLKAKLAEAWRALKHEFITLLSPLDYSVEKVRIKNQENLYFQQFFLVGLTLAIIHLGNFIFQFVTKAPPRPGKLFVTIVYPILFAASIGVMIGAKYIRNDHVRLTVCLTSYLSFIFWAERTFYLAKYDLLLSGENRAFNISLRMVATFNISRVILINQPLTILLPMLITESVYILIRCGIETNNTTLLVRTAAILLMYVFLNYLSRHAELAQFQRLEINQQNVQGIINLLDNISTHPVYIFRMSEIEAFLERGSENSNLSQAEELKELMIRSLEETFFPRDKVLGATGVGQLEQIFFDNDSQIEAKKSQSQVGLDPTGTEDSKAINSVLSIVLHKTFENMNVLEIILEIYTELLGYGLKAFCYQFSMLNVSNRALFDHEDFQLFDVDINFVVLKGFPSIVVVVKDISDRIVRDTLEQKNQGMDLALSSLTHDMRAPLHAILGYAEIVTCRIGELQQQDELFKSVQENAKKISANCEHLSLMVNDFLDLTRLAFRKFTPIVSRFDLAVVARECLEIAKTVQDSGKVLFSYEGPPQLFVSNDAHRIKRVLLNLVANSIKYTDKGSIVIRLESQEDMVQVHVVDTGRGIEKNIQKKLGNPLFSFSKGAATNKEGIGLGLSTTKELLKILGPSGAIKIQSELNRGSQFSFQVYKNLSEDASFQPLSATGQGLDTPGYSKNKKNHAARPNKFPRDWMEPILEENSRIYSPGKPASRFLSTSNPKKEPKKVTTNVAGTSKVKIVSVRDLGATRSTKDAHFSDSSSKGSDSARRLVEDRKTSSYENEPGMSTIPLTLPKKKLSEFQNQKVSFKVDKPLECSSSGINIFLLEDDTFNRDILNMYLMRYFKTNEAANLIKIDMCATVSESVTLIKENAARGVSYSLVMTDYHVGEGQTGPDFVRIVKKIYTEHEILHPTFISVSGISIQDPNEANLFFRCILKPFSFDQFSAEMDRWMEVTHRKISLQSGNQANPLPP